MQIARLLHLRVCSTAAPLLASLSAFDVNKQAVISQRIDGRTVEDISRVETNVS